MTTVKVALSGQMADWVEEQARSGRYAGPDDYLRDLVRRDQERAGRVVAMQALVDEGLGSGVGERSMGDIRIDARRRLGL